MPHVNFGQVGRALEFLAKRDVGAYIVSFQVRYEFLEFLRVVAVDQNERDVYPDSPQKDDPRQAPDQYGIWSNLFAELLEDTIPGSARIIRDGGEC